MHTTSTESSAPRTLAPGWITIAPVEPPQCLTTVVSLVVRLRARRVESIDLQRIYELGGMAVVA